MPGMGHSNISLSNSMVESLFHHSAYVTAVFWIIGTALALLVAAALFGRLANFNVSRAGLGEPRARTYLRFGFGALWLVDGFLQFQPSMPLGLANGVVRPAVAGAPSWLHSLMFSGIHLWNSHPIALATGTAWIQIGIGLALITSNATVGRVAGAVSAGWAALIWVIGNGAGGAFASGASILSAGPGRRCSTSLPGCGSLRRRATLHGTSLAARFASSRCYSGSPPSCSVCRRRVSGTAVTPTPYPP